MIPGIIREQAPTTLQNNRQVGNHRNRMRRKHNGIRDLPRHSLPDIVISDDTSDNNDDDDPNNSQGSSRRFVEIKNRPRLSILPRQSGHSHGQDINLLDRQIARARKRLRQQEKAKSPNQKKGTLYLDSESSPQQKRRVFKIREKKVRDSKPGFQISLNSGLRRTFLTESLRNH